MLNVVVCLFSSRVGGQARACACDKDVAAGEVG